MNIAALINTLPQPLIVSAMHAAAFPILFGGGAALRRSLSASRAMTVAACMPATVAGLTTAARFLIDGSPRASFGFGVTVATIFVAVGYMLSLPFLLIRVLIFTPTHDFPPVTKDCEKGMKNATQIIASL